MAQIFKNAKAVLSDTDTDVYTVPSNTTSIVIGCQVANVNGASDRTLQFWWTDSSDTNAVTHLGYDILIPFDAVYEPINGKLVLEEGDKLVGLGSSASDLEVSLSILEIS